ncbi:unnamed protein product [Caenorhabditis auriculariae]|uniref:Uncharacterized protein n=1 Tax=Caenorhabditis auriculariae TaxID=2777116 RepID=A0A8S1HBL6_9PELO|nr:unnamed protein product [Caenorhabditis auriculariae]
MDNAVEETTDLPSVGHWFHTLPTVYIIFIALCILLWFGIAAMTCILVRNVHFHVPNETVQSDLYFIIFIPLVVSTCCVFGNILVRASALLYAVALTYLLICLHMTVFLIVRLFGNRRGLAKWLIDNNKVIVFNTKPYCCCCNCLPTMKPTPTRVRRISYLVKQSPIVRICIQLVLMVMAAEEMDADMTISQVLNGVGVISTLLAVYVSHILVTTTLERLEPFNMFTIFKCVNISQMLFTLQKFFLDLLAKNGAMGGLSMAPPTTVSRFWHNTAMTVWLTIVAHVMVKNIRPGKSKFFCDKPFSENDIPLTDNFVDCAEVRSTEPCTWNPRPTPSEDAPSDDAEVITPGAEKKQLSSPSG